MTQRRRLDAYLAERASQVGAVFRDGSKVEAIEARNDGVAIRLAGGERLRARALVGADGVNGVCCRALRLGGNREVGVAIEGNVSYDRLRTDGWRGRIVLELGVVPGGYGWVFPKGDHANIGIGGWASEGTRLRAHLRELCRQHGISPDDLHDVRGYRLPLRSPNSTLARARALIVGDAAGLIDPISGDGMYEGFLSSKLASEAVLDLLEGRKTSLDPYGPRLAGLLATHLWASWGVKGALDRFPRTTFALASTRIVWRAVERLVQGDVPHVGAVHGLARPPLKALALLARVAGDPGRAYREA
jgi:flavin-dependent dehydrogenase